MIDRRGFLAASLAAGAAGSARLNGCAGTASAGAVPSGAPAGNGQRLIRLSANENPLGMSPAARQAVLTGMTETNRYPRAPRTELIGAIAAKHGVPAAQIQLGTGSSEILQMTVHMTSPGTVVIAADPTFEDVPGYAAAAGRRVVKVPLLADGSHHVARMREEAGRAERALVFICNPNNPTGTLTPSADVESWIAASDERTTFVVDEAYFEFAEHASYRSAERLAATRPGVVVVRTFSKVHGMAGLRIGYALAHPSTIALMRAWACNVNANILGLLAARASLGDPAWQQRSLDANRTGRRLVESALDSLGLERLPSHANFVMHRIGAGDLQQYISRMGERGIQVGRAFPPMLRYNRVSIGTLGEMETFVEELRGFRSRGWV